jgi:large subunit ribosomal protein L12
MEYIYAAMLLHKAGKEITENALTQILKSAGLTVDVVRVKALVATLSEVNIEEAVKSTPSLISAPSVPTVAEPSETKPKAEEAKKKEEEDASKEEAALEGLGALFG